MNLFSSSLDQARKSRPVWFVGLVAQPSIEAGSHLAAPVACFFRDTRRMLMQMLLTLAVGRSILAAGFLFNLLFSCEGKEG